MKKMFIVFALMVCLFSVNAFAADISGNWQINRVGPQGAEVWKLTIKADGNNFTVTGTHSGLGEFTGSGTMDGNKFTMLNYLQTGPGRIHVQFEGVIDGNKMSGTSKSVGIDNNSASGSGAQAGSAPQAGGSAPAGGGAPPSGGSAPTGGAPAGGAPAGGQGGASAAGGSGVDHTQPIAFTGERK